MKMPMNSVNHVHTTVQIVPTQLIVTLVQKTESIYHPVPVQPELMKSSKKTVHHVTTDVKLVLIKMITVLLVPKTEFLNQVVIVLMEHSILKDKPIVNLVILTSVIPVLMMQEIVSSVPETELTHQPVSHQKPLLNPSMLEISQSVPLKSLFVMINVYLVNNMETIV
jgi:hypothetical protein